MPDSLVGGGEAPPYDDAPRHGDAPMPVACFRDRGRAAGEKAPAEEVQSTSKSRVEGDMPVLFVLGLAFPIISVQVGCRAIPLLTTILPSDLVCHSLSAYCLTIHFINGGCKLRGGGWIERMSCCWCVCVL